MNYYELLNIEITASTVEIKKAYRKMAMKWHPDRNNNSKESEEQFKNIKEAYETLSNESARFWYDREVINSSAHKFNNSSFNQTNSHQEQPNSNDADQFTKSENNNDNFREKDDSIFEEHYDSSNQNYEENSTSQSDDTTYNKYSFWEKKYPFSNFHEYNLEISEDLSILGGKTNFNYPWNNNFININVTIKENFNPNNVLEVKLTDHDILLIFINILENPNKHLDIYSKIELDIFSALHGVHVDIPTSSGIHNIYIPALTRDGDNLTFLGLGLKGKFFIGNLYIKVHVFYPHFFTDEQKDLLSQLSSIQIRRDKHIFSKIFHLLKEIYYSFLPKNRK